VPLIDSVDPVTETTGAMFESMETLTGRAIGSCPKALATAKKLHARTAGTIQIFFMISYRQNILVV